ncbi:unnamed protein product [Angiostrongylus costaricensis]|uniref:Uncharacterized protein n=1 Tax=Angiostrongylus costaricensis TaxID=334426 RepID=A0A0R3PCH1_ANGCS|nr:unnamed protein product [Angiostrongylus costaricensis]
MTRLHVFCADPSTSHVRFISSHPLSTKIFLAALRVASPPHFRTQRCITMPSLQRMEWCISPSECYISELR